MKVLEVQFVNEVRLPTGGNGKGISGKKKLLIDHPETPYGMHDMTWSVETDELIVRHVATGVTIGVPRANIAWMRPPLAELLTAPAPSKLPEGLESAAAKREMGLGDAATSGRALAEEPKPAKVPEKGKAA